MLHVLLHIIHTAAIRMALLRPNVGCDVVVCGLNWSDAVISHTHRWHRLRLNLPCVMHRPRRSNKLEMELTIPELKILSYDDVAGDLCAISKLHMRHL